MMVMAVMDAEQSHCPSNVLTSGWFVNRFPEALATPLRLRGVCLNQSCAAFA